jgi:hypothetical protein
LLRVCLRSLPVDAIETVEFVAVGAVETGSHQEVRFESLLGQGGEALSFAKK